MSSFYVEFEIASEEQFRKLSDVFAALLAAKTSDDWKDDSYWLTFFDDAAKSNFWWPTAAEIEDWKRRWFSTPVEKRWNDPTLRNKWIFGSLIEAFRNGDYALVGCRRTPDGCGRIEFDPYGHPYGGTECMRVLIESFGHRVVEVRDRRHALIRRVANLRHHFRHLARMRRNSCPPARYSGRGLG